MKKEWRIFFVVILSIFFTITARAVNINVNIPGASAVSNGDPVGMVANFYSFALLISGILAFGAIVWGGVQYALAAGNPSGQSEGKDWIMGALLGLLLLAGASLLLNTINPDLIKLNIQPLPAIPSTPLTGGQTQLPSTQEQTVVPGQAAPRQNPSTPAAEIPPAVSPDEQGPEE